MPLALGGTDLADEAGQQNDGQDIRQRLHGCTGHLADAGKLHALQPDRDRSQEPEKQAGAKRRQRPPIGENERRQSDEPLAGGHVLDEACRLGNRQVGAAKAAQQAGNDHRTVAQCRHRNAGGIHGVRVFADRAQPQAETRAGREPRR